MSFFGRVVFAIRLTAAQHAASRKRYSRAREILREIFKACGSKEPTEKAPVISVVFFANISEALDDYESAALSCEIAVRTLTATQAILDDDDRTFLLFMCKWIESRIIYADISWARRFSHTIDVRWKDVRTDRVTPSLKRLLPFDGSQGEQVDLFMEVALN